MGFHSLTLAKEIETKNDNEEQILIKKIKL